MRNKNHRLGTLNLDTFRKLTNHLPGDTPIWIEIEKDHCSETWYENSVKEGKDILGEKIICIKTILREDIY